MKYCAHCGKEHCDEAVICTGCGMSFEPAKPAKPLPMKWDKFLIYFYIIAEAVINAILGISKVTGLTIYPVTIPDVIYGILLIGLAVFGFVTRHRLAKFKKNGPATLYALYICETVVSLIYTLLTSAFATAASDNTVFMIGYAVGEIFGQLFSTALFVFLNYIYFKKRRELFCN